MLIYPKYALWVFVYTILFAMCSLFFGKLLETLASKYDRAFLQKNQNKHKFRLILEICLQLGATSVGVYIFRELITSGMQHLFKIDKKPHNFAAVVISTVVFSQQPMLMNKIKHLLETIFK